MTSHGCVYNTLLPTIEKHHEEIEKLKTEIGQLQKALFVQPTFKVKLLSPNALVPVRANIGDAGYDLFSSVSTIIPAHGKELVKTDISIAISDGYYGRIAPRSGLALKHFIDVGAGVIDKNFRGNIGVLLFNFSDKDFVVKKGDRVAQMVFEVIATPILEVVDDLDETERIGGFGSTGMTTTVTINKNGAIECREE